MGSQVDLKEYGIAIYILERFIERSLLAFHCISLAVEGGEVLQGEVLLAVLAQVEAVLVPCHNIVTVTCHASRVTCHSHLTRAPAATRTARCRPGPGSWRRPCHGSASAGGECYLSRVTCTGEMSRATCTGEMSRVTCPVHLL